MGLGYVGLPLAIRFSEEKFNVIGFDIDENKINILNSGNSFIKHIEKNKISTLIKEGFLATNDFSKICKIDVIIICVPTPLGLHNEPDMRYVHETLDSIKSYLKENQLIILESTTYPGTTEEIIVPFIEDLGFKVGKNYFVGYSPEREDPGNKKYSTKTIPKIISGATENCLSIMQVLYDAIVDKAVPVSAPRVAEMTKILENIHRAVNIGLVNELKMVTDKMDIDIYEVIQAASTKPFGFTPYYPGPGLGGHCIPIDPFYLTWKAKEVGINTRFIELAGEINTAMPNYVIQKISDVLNKLGKSIKNSKIFMLGLAYKKNVDDIRESPALEILDKLLILGAVMKYNDPYVKYIPPTRKYNLELSSTPLTTKNIKSADIVLLTTDHDEYDYDLIEKEAKLIVDTRGRFKSSNKISKA